mmetsp:Transcript_722/g.896  ORF Transcript_722/g.896 Transcript_722/m.896 type:complete len:92 (+) Transcript_722:1440-1715(+)
MTNSLYEVTATAESPHMASPAFLKKNDSQEEVRLAGDFQSTQKRGTNSVVSQRAGTLSPNPPLSKGVRDIISLVPQSYNNSSINRKFMHDI